MTYEKAEPEMAGLLLGGIIAFFVTVRIQIGSDVSRDER
jgi:hypothetical protein